MKKLTLIIGLILIASFSFGQANVAEVDQWGFDNIVTIKQVGACNYAYAFEAGGYNTMWMCQTGCCNTELLYVCGYGNQIWYPGCGGYGGFFVYFPYNFCCWGFKVYTAFCFDPTNVMHQWGCNNFALLEICGDMNRVAQTQIGTDNAADLLVCGDWNFSMQYQAGHGNYSGVNIFGCCGRVLTYQCGLGNVSLVNQFGCMNDAATLQIGSYHVASITQHPCSYNNLAIINQFDFHGWQPNYWGMCCPCHYGN